MDRADASSDCESVGCLAAFASPSFIYTPLSSPADKNDLAPFSFQF